MPGTPREIPILKIPYSTEDKRYISQETARVLDSGMLSMGRCTAAFEEAFAGFVGVDHCVAVSNGTAALEAILRALDVYGRAVIVPTNTFMATALAVMHAGARVVFADSDPATLCLDPADVERRLDDDVAAVIHVHIGGIMAPSVHRIASLCETRGIAFVEDCAHAQGSSLEGRAAGSIGIAGAFSFFPTKVLTTGEGGAITTRDPELDARARVIRNQGKDPHRGGRIGYPGHNLRISEMTAVLGMQQVDRAADIIHRRREVAAMYDALLEDVDTITPVAIPPGAVSTYYKYLANLPEGCDRTKVKRIMKEELGVSLTGEVYAELCHEEPLWDDYTYCGVPRAVGCSKPGCKCDVRQNDFPGADRLKDRHICLPLYPGLDEADARWVVTALERTVAEIGENG